MSAAFLFLSQCRISRMWQGYAVLAVVRSSYLVPVSAASWSARKARSPRRGQRARRSAGTALPLPVAG